MPGSQPPPQSCAVASSALPSTKATAAVKAGKGGEHEAESSIAHGQSAATANSTSRPPLQQRARSSGPVSRPPKSRQDVRSLDRAVSQQHKRASPTPPERPLPLPPHLSSRKSSSDALPQPVLPAAAAASVPCQDEVGVECWEQRLDESDIALIAASTRPPIPAVAAAAAASAAASSDSLSQQSITNSRVRLKPSSALTVDVAEPMPDATSATAQPPPPISTLASPAATSSTTDRDAQRDESQTLPASSRSQSQQGATPLLCQPPSSPNPLLATPRTAAVSRFPLQGSRGQRSMQAQQASASCSPTFSPADAFHPGVAAPAAAPSPQRRGGRSGSNGRRAAHARSQSLNLNVPNASAPPILTLPAADPRYVQLLSAQACANWPGMAVFPGAMNAQLCEAAQREGALTFAVGELQHQHGEAKARAEILEAQLAQAEARADQAESRATEAERRLTLAEAERAEAAPSQAEMRSRSSTPLGLARTATSPSTAHSRSSTPLTARTASAGSTSPPISPFLRALLSMDDGNTPLAHIDLLGDLMSLSPLPSATAAGPSADDGPSLSAHFERAFSLTDPLAVGRGLGTLNGFFSSDLSATVSRRTDKPGQAASDQAVGDSASSASAASAWSAAGVSTDDRVKVNIWASSTETADQSCSVSLMLPLIDKRAAHRRDEGSSSIAPTPLTAAQAALAQVLAATAVTFEHGVAEAFPIDGTHQPLNHQPGPAASAVRSQPSTPTSTGQPTPAEKSLPSAWSGASRPLLATINASSSTLATSSSGMSLCGGGNDSSQNGGASAGASGGSVSSTGGCDHDNGGKRDAADQEARDAELAAAIAAAEAAKRPASKRKKVAEVWVKVGANGKPKFTRAQLREKAKEKERAKATSKAAKSASKPASAVASAASSAAPSPAVSAPSSPTRPPTVAAASRAAPQTVSASSQPAAESGDLVVPARERTHVACEPTTISPAVPLSTSADSGSRTQPTDGAEKTAPLFDVGTTVECDLRLQQRSSSQPVQPQQPPSEAEMPAAVAAAAADPVDREPALPATPEPGPQPSCADAPVSNIAIGAKAQSTSKPLAVDTSRSSGPPKSSDTKHQHPASSSGPSYGDRPQQAASHANGISVLKPIVAAPSAHLNSALESMQTATQQRPVGNGATGPQFWSMQASPPAQSPVSLRRRPSPPPHVQPMLQMGSPVSAFPYPLRVSYPMPLLPHALPHAHPGPPMFFMPQHFAPVHPHAHAHAHAHAYSYAQAQHQQQMAQHQQMFMRTVSQLQPQPLTPNTHQARGHAPQFWQPHT